MTRIERERRTETSLGIGQSAGSFERQGPLDVRLIARGIDGDNPVAEVDRGREVTGVERDGGGQLQRRGWRRGLRQNAGQNLPRFGVEAGAAIFESHGETWIAHARDYKVLTNTP